LETCPELKKAVQGQRGHVGFTPSLSSLLHLLLKLYPPAGTKHTEIQTQSGITMKTAENRVRIYPKLLNC